MKNKAIIKTRTLTKKFKDFTAVDSLDLEIYEGEIYALLGPNGAGKTTTMSMLSTLIAPTSGKAFVNGFDISTQKDSVRQDIGIVFQDPSTDFKLTGRENMLLHCMLYKVPKKEREARIKNAFEMVELSEWADKEVKHYSGGMKQRLELARGILHEPKVLFLDEPTVGLDPQTREHVWKYIYKMVQEKKITILMSTHYLEEAERFADRIGIIDHGKLLVEGKPKEILERTCFDKVIIEGKADATKLKRMKFVKKVKIDGSKITVQLSNASRNIKELMGAVGTGASVKVEPATLNDVFVKYTGKGLRDEEN